MNPSQLCLVVTSVTSYFRSCICKRLFFQHVCSFYDPYTLPTISRACYPRKPSLGYSSHPLPQNRSILSWKILRCSQEHLWGDRFLHLYHFLYVFLSIRVPYLILIIIHFARHRVYDRSLLPRSNFGFHQSFDW